MQKTAIDHFYQKWQDKIMRSVNRIETAVRLVYDINNNNIHFQHS